MSGWTGFGLFCLFIAALVAFQVIRSRRGRRVFRELAAQLGGEWTPGYAWDAGVVRAPYRGGFLSLDTHTTGGTRNNTTYTRLCATFPSDKPLDFLLFPRSLASRMLVTGLTKIPFPLTAQSRAVIEPLRETLEKEVRTGDEEFDGQYMIRGEVSESVIRALSDGETKRLLERARIHQLHVACAGHECSLQLTLTGEVFGADRLSALIDLAKKLCVSLSVGQ